MFEFVCPDDSRLLNSGSADMKGMRRNLQRDIMGSIIHRYTPASTHLVDLVSVLLWPALEKKKASVRSVTCDVFEEGRRGFQKYFQSSHYHIGDKHGATITHAGDY